MQTTADLNSNDKNLMEQKAKLLGHDLHDQHFLQHEQNQQILKLTEENRFAVHSLTDKQNAITSTNIISEATNVGIESDRADYDSPVPEPVSKMNQTAYESKEKPSGYKDEYETSNIQTPQVNLAPINDASFNVVSLGEVIPDDINVDSDGLDAFKNFGI
ncbi:unnamed protein product, partial [Rotaria sp. Silwood2]